MPTKDYCTPGSPHEAAGPLGYALHVATSDPPRQVIPAMRWLIVAGAILVIGAGTPLVLAPERELRPGSKVK